MTLPAGTTTNYHLKIYNATTDAEDSFLHFREMIAGTEAGVSNLQILDSALYAVSEKLDSSSIVKPLSAVYNTGDTRYDVDASLYITSYVNNDIILLTLDVNNVGATTLYLTNDALGGKILARVDNSGSVANFEVGELIGGRYYLFVFITTLDKWILVSCIDTDKSISISDNTTNNVSTTAHGFVPKAVAPASGTLNVYGIGNGETAASNKTLFDSTNPEALGTVGSGTSLLAARRDHVHTKPTLDGLASPTDVTTLDVSSTAHGLIPKAVVPASGDLNVFGIANGETAVTNKSILSNASPASVGTAATGTSIAASRSDHVHGIANATTSVKGIASFATADFVVSSGAVSIGEASTSKKGLAPIVTAPTGNYLKVLGVGSSDTGYVLKDLFGTTAAPPQATGTSLSAGTALTAARLDHVHTTGASDYTKRIVTVSLNGSTELTTSDKSYIRIPAALNGYKLISVAGMCFVPSSSGTVTITVKKASSPYTSFATMLSTDLTLTATTYDSTNAVVNAAVNSVATADHIEIACSGAGAAVTYLTVELVFQLP